MAQEMHGHWIMLHDLKPGALLRGKPLGTILAEYKHVNGKVWQRIRASDPVAVYSFDQLGKAWTANMEWRIPAI